MKRVVLGSLMMLSACQTGPVALGGGAGGGGGAFQEFLVLGSNMSFEQCRARGGLIIRDSGSPMVACDPSVTGEPVPADEFNHPESQAVAAAQAATTDA